MLIKPPSRPPPPNISAHLCSFVAPPPLAPALATKLSSCCRLSIRKISAPSDTGAPAPAAPASPPDTSAPVAAASSAAGGGGDAVAVAPDPTTSTLEAAPARAGAGAVPTPEELVLLLSLVLALGPSVGPLCPFSAPPVAAVAAAFFLFFFFLFLLLLLVAVVVGCFGSIGAADTGVVVAGLVVPTELLLLLRSAGAAEELPGEAAAFPAVSVATTATTGLAASEGTASSFSATVDDMAAVVGGLIP